MRRTMVGVVVYGHSKDYALMPFFDMAAKCILPHDNVDLFIWSDWIEKPENANSQKFDVFPMAHGIRPWSEDVLIPAHEEMRKFAIDRGYDKMVWQGVDCFYQSPEDFLRLISWDVDSVAALTAAREDSDYAVARRFHTERNGWSIKYKETQYDIPRQELVEGIARRRLVPAGYPSSDTLVLSRKCFDVQGLTTLHDPWYRRVEQGRPSIAAEEWYCLQLANRGITSWIDCGVLTWHAHDTDLVARMYPGIETPLGELGW